MAWNSKNNKPEGRGISLSQLFPIVVIAGLMLGPRIIDATITPEGEKEKDLPYSELIKLTNSNQVQKVTVFGDHVIARSVNDKGATTATYKVTIPANFDIEKTLAKKDVEISIDNSSFWDSANLTQIVLMILAFELAWSVFKNSALKKKLFREKEIKEEKSNVTFDDVAGIDSIKEEVQEVVNLLKNKDQNRLGIIPPGGLLLAGAPGNGKTLLAKAIAGEAGVPFFSAAATEFENMFYGNSAKQVRDLFKMARKKSPCIIFIDEIDAIGRTRSGDNRSASDSIVVELLNQMDGFEGTENVLVIAATNRPEVLDPALLRPGRFDKKIVVPQPDFKARRQILDVHTRKRPLADDVDLDQIAHQLYSFSGADIANLVNQAAIIAARDPNATTITQHNFEQAIDRITMGLKRSISMSQEELWATSVHEAGHTIITLEKEKDGAMPLHKVTVVPHGDALGLTIMRPPQDIYRQTLKQLKTRLTIDLGGRIAEEIMLGGPLEAGTGASGDIEDATRIAWNMVTRFGFSDLGMVKYGNGGNNYLGTADDRNLDSYTAAQVNKQVTKIIGEAEAEAREILTRRKHDLERLALELKARETLEADDVRSLLSLSRNDTAPAPGNL